MKPAEGWSLARRLSLRLAAQTVIGSALVSALVYGLAGVHLASRQEKFLEGQRMMVQHMLRETRRDGDLDNLRHRLDDYFAGHQDLSLELTVLGSAPFYQSEHPIPEARARTTDFELAAIPNVLGPLKARLALDLGADRQLLDHLALSLAASSLLGALAVSLAGWLQVRRGLEPMQELVSQTKALAASTLHQRLDASAQPLELKPLVDHFNDLLARLDTAYRQLEGFNADVAHELNTPLATLITRSELALRKERDVQVLREMMGEHLEDLRRLSGIVRDMLFLAHADRGDRARRSRVSSVSALASSVMDYHEAMLLDAGLEAQVMGDAEGDLDVSLLKRALSNLLSNATRYATPGTTVRIEVERKDRTLSLCVANQGPAIEQEHLPRIFDRFYRADMARTGAGAHHGLGLAIVAAIARMHGGEPWASSADGWTRVGFWVPIPGSNAQFTHSPGRNQAELLQDE